MKEQLGKYDSMRENSKVSIAQTYVGRGSFAAVRRATHKATGKDYAVKIISKKDCKDVCLHRVYLFDISAVGLVVMCLLRLCMSDWFLSTIYNKWRRSSISCRCSTTLIS